MKTFLLPICLFVASSAMALATSVTYSTTSSQICLGSTCGTSLDFGGTVRLTFQAVNSSTVNANPTTNSSFGTLVFSCIGGGTSCGSVSLPTGLILNIVVQQSTPSSGSGSLPSGSIRGSIAGTSSSSQIQWPTNNTISIGAIRYSVANNPLDLVPPSVNSGRTTIQARITDTTIPEPATYAMFSAALVGFGLIRFKRR